MPTTITYQFTEQALTSLLSDVVRLGIREYERNKKDTISHRKAVKDYGKWFEDAVAKGKVKGRRAGAGKNSKIVYLVSDIESVRLQDRLQASVIIK